MFGRFRKPPVSPEPTATKTPVDLSRRTYTRALLGTSAAAASQIQNEFTAIGISFDTGPAATDLDGQIASAIRLITGQIVLAVLERLGRTNEFIPHTFGRVPGSGVGRSCG